MPLNLRAGSAGLLSIAIGTIAGRLVDIPFGLPQEAMTLLYKPLRGVFEALSPYSYGALALAALLYRLPIVLAAGLAIGLTLSRLQYPRLAVYCLLAWPAYYFFEHLLLIALMQRGEQLSGGPPIVASSFRDRLGLEMSIYCVEYLLLFLIIFATNAAVVRANSTRRTRMKRR